MCGIVGYVDLRGEGRVEERIVRRMTEALMHRGPDSHGYFVDENAALGTRRLSIIAGLSPGSADCFRFDCSSFR